MSNTWPRPFRSKSNATSRSRQPQRSLLNILDALESRILFSVSPALSFKIGPAVRLAPLVTVNHAPTANSTATLSSHGFPTTPHTITYGTLLTASGAQDADNDAIEFRITAVSAASGSLQITHGGLTSSVIVGKTNVVTGDTLIWTPASKDAGTVNAFTMKAFDGKALAATATRVLVPVTAIPTITITTGSTQAWESTAGTASHNGTVQILRSGGDPSTPVTVTIRTGGSATQGIDYILIAPDGFTILTGPTTTVTIPGGQSSVTLTLAPLQNNVANPTLTATVTIEPDPNTPAPGYLLPTIASTATASVNILDSNQTVTIAAASANIQEGGGTQNAFTVTRTAAAGGDLSAPLTVNIAYSGGFNRTDGHFFAPSSITFPADVATETIFIDPTNNGSAFVPPSNGGGGGGGGGGGNGSSNSTQNITATLATGSTFTLTNKGTASVNVLDASPNVGITVVTATTLENSTASQITPGEFLVTRTGSTDTSLAVLLTVATSSGDAVLGTDFTMSSARKKVTTLVTIPAGKSSIPVFVLAKDNRQNSSLNAVINVVANGGAYSVDTSNSASIAITNFDRAPTVLVATVQRVAPRSGSITLSYTDLVNLTGAALARNETRGTLQLSVTALSLGTIETIAKGTTTPVTAAAGAILNPGDKLIWIAPQPPNSTSENDTLAFNIGAVDGTDSSATTTAFNVNIP